MSRLADGFSAIGNYFAGLLDNTAMTYELIIWALCVGIVIASAIALYNYRTPGKIVRALLAAKCTGRDNAKSLVELGLNKPSMRRALSTDESLRKTIAFADVSGTDVSGTDVSGTDVSGADNSASGTSADKSADTSAKKAKKAKPVKINFSTVKMYIPEENEFRAESLYDRRGSLPAVILAAMLFIAIAVACITIMPKIISMLQDLVGSF